MYIYILVLFLVIKYYQACNKIIKKCKTSSITHNDNKVNEFNLPFIAILHKTIYCNKHPLAFFGSLVL